MATSVKKNLGWNLLLTVSGYLFPLLTFPYVTRVLGASNLGIANFAISIADYAIIFASFGIVDIGTRYISHCNNVEDKNKIFSALVSLHIIMSLIIIGVYTIAVLSVPQLRVNYSLYLVGIVKIIFNIFLIEWLFQGLQEFRYITIRTLITRILYVIGIFAFVRTENDYDAYFYVSIAQIALNAFLNWRYSRKFVSFKFSIKGLREYIYPVFSMGINRILLSFYSTFNVLFLGFMCTTESVGYFSTATKLYGIFIGFISAFNGVLVPHLNSLVGQGRIEEYRNMIEKSFSVVSLLSIPVAVGAITFAPQIIRLIAGPGFENAILPFQIIMIQTIFVSLAQITENQILLTFKKFNQILICTILGTALSLVILLLYVKQYAETASAMAVAIPHVIEFIALYVFAKKTFSFKFPLKDVINICIICLPMIAIYLLLRHFLNNYLLILLLGGSICLFYYICMELFVVKNKFVQCQVSAIFVRLSSIFRK